MSREIKFRAWSYGIKSDTSARRKQYGDWVSPPQMLYDEKPGDCLVWKSQGQNIEVMQYTGLRDKKGKEIYEGDIVSGGRLNCTGGFAIENERTVVNFDKGMFRAKNMSLVSFARGCEVIGNIYEHAHLLEARSAIGTTESA